MMSKKETKNFNNRVEKWTTYSLSFSMLVVFLSLLSFVVLYKISYYLNVQVISFWYIYSLLAGLFLLSRILFSFWYDDSELHIDFEETGSYFKYPKVSFIIAAKNEENSIFRTIKTCMDSDYPEHMECIVVDDGSTDRTFTEMQRARKDVGDDKVTVISFDENKGKREAMSEGVLIAKNEIIIFVDSDSFIEKDSVKLLVQHFKNKKIGAVSGNTKVANADVNMLTKMQSIRYAVSYDVFKASESVYGTVSCCPGCFSGYRKSAIIPVLSQWRNQTLMGTRSTFGDDRSLTNFVLKTWDVVYCKNAKAITIVPEKYSKFLKQQLRWKKSWVREGFVSSSFMWKKHPVAAVSFYINLILPTLGPFVVGWVLYMTISNYNLLFIAIFLAGVTLMGLLFSTYLYLTQRERYIFYMLPFSIFYTLVLIWQMPYAIMTLKNTSWGTR